MQLMDLNDHPQPGTESIGLAARAGLVAFCLAAGLSYRILVGVLPASGLQAGVLTGLAAFFLLLTSLARRAPQLRKYSEIPFAFFVFTLAGLVGDQGGFMQQRLVRQLLHETPNSHNPLAATVMGSVFAQVVS